MRHGVASGMSKADSLAMIVEALGGTATGTSTKDLLADCVTALGGTPAGDSIADLLAEVAAAYAEATKDLKKANIKKDVTILGVKGTYTGE